MDALQSGADTLFVLLGAILVLWMHAGFAFLEVGTVREKNQVNALVKIICDFGVSTVAYFFIGYSIAYGIDFFRPAPELTAGNGYELVKFFFLLTFAAAIPAIISGGIAERARFYPQLLASIIIVAVAYPFFEQENNPAQYPSQMYCWRRRTHASIAGCQAPIWTLQAPDFYR